MNGVSIWGKYGGKFRRWDPPLTSMTIDSYQLCSMLFLRGLQGSLFAILARYDLFPPLLFTTDTSPAPTSPSRPHKQRSSNS